MKCHTCKNWQPNELKCTKTRWIFCFGFRWVKR